MLKKLLNVALLLLPLCVFSQKVDLDKFKFKVEYQILPTVNVPIENRTFNTVVKVGSAIKGYLDEKSIDDKLSIYGWKKTEENPTVTISVNLEDFLKNGVESKSETSENKDKDGKVISKTTSYYVSASFKSIGNIKINGPFMPPVLTEKQLAEQQKKDEIKSTNKFLKSATIEKKEDESYKEKIEYVNNNYEFTTDKFSTSTAASDSYKNRAASIYDEKLRTFVDNSIDRVKSNSNFYFGFRPYADDDYLWILNSKSHPEFQNQQDAIVAVKELFGTMKANESIATLQENFDPLIDYFNSLKTKYASKEKGDAKLRYSAYYNLAKIYMYLDKPELAIIEAEGLIKNDYDEKDGKRLKESAEELVEMFKVKKFKTRHNQL